MQGTLALTGQQQLDFATSGSINLKPELLDPDFTASGNHHFTEALRPVTYSPCAGASICTLNALEGVPNG